MTEMQSSVGAHPARHTSTLIWFDWAPPPVIVTMTAIPAVVAMLDWTSVVGSARTIMVMVPVFDTTGENQRNEKQAEAMGDIHAVQSFGVNQTWVNIYAMI
jgi:hypothetical protein